MNPRQGGWGVGVEAAQCEVPQGDTLIEEEGQVFVVWEHPDVRLPFRQGLRAEEYHQAYLPDVPFATLSAMSIGQDAPQSHVQHWLVARRIVREANIRLSTQGFLKSHAPSHEQWPFAEFL